VGLDELARRAAAVPELEQRWATVSGTGDKTQFVKSRPHREQALAVVAASLAKAVPMGPDEALARYRYPWRMPFLLRPAQQVPLGLGRSVALHHRSSTS
jgi:hypothetical protein